MSLASSLVPRRLLVPLAGECEEIERVSRNETILPQLCRGGGGGGGGGDVSFIPRLSCPTLIAVKNLPH